jgi:hypothetical protein
MCSVVERSVHARFEVNRSNHLVYASVHILSRKLYLNSRRACGGDLLAGIFFLFILLFSSFYYYFIFQKLICRGGSWPGQPYKSISWGG